MLAVPEMIVRYLAKPIEEDLARKMVFVGGPRQVGKTTLGDDAPRRRNATPRVPQLGRCARSPRPLAG